ncbi:ADAMTS cysteine-rich domain [Popillia japonica]|uniref:ADAMTS cysteine-rich domain n=1 Tax=Popillia japonica TaxID=7064 RepID=A0AAW1KGU4_POPJA
MHLCNTQDCPVVQDFRAQQCAHFNNRPFKGKIYIWHPYAHVLPQYECALNCEAVGGGFYARLNETVIDGTPCSNPAKIHGKRASFGALSVCVDGYCQAVDPPGFASRKIRSGPGHSETKRLEPGNMQSMKRACADNIGRHDRYLPPMIEAELSDENETDREDKTVQLQSSSFEDFYPTPRITEKVQCKRRRTQKSLILTSTSIQVYLEEKEDKRQKKKAQKALILTSTSIQVYLEEKEDKRQKKKADEAKKIVFQRKIIRT